MSDKKNVRAREIDRIAGRQVFAKTCGVDICNGGAFEGRLVDRVRGQKVFAVASECNEAPDFNLDPSYWVAHDCIRPLGTTRKLKAVAAIGGSNVQLIRCFGDNLCPEINLTFDGTYWTGSFTPPGIEVQVQCIPSPTGGNPSFIVKLSGCINPIQIYTIPSDHVTCFAPLSFRVQATFSIDCCPDVPNPPYSFNITISAYTDHTLPARLVNRLKGVKVFATAECCTGTDYNPSPCYCKICVASTNYAFSVSGLSNNSGTNCFHCPLLNTSYLLTYNDSCPNECMWDTGHNIDICSDGEGLRWVMTPTAGNSLFGPIDGMILNLIQSCVGNQLDGFAVYQCRCPAFNPFGTSTFTLVETGTSGPPNICNGWPGTLTISAVGSATTTVCSCNGGGRPGRRPMPRRPQPVAVREVPTVGPGTELKELLSSIGIIQGQCNCETKVRMMNSWGVQGCTERRDEILSWLRSEQKRMGWFKYIGSALRMLTSGFVPNPVDPVASILDEAIRRARLKEYESGKF